MVEPLPPSSKEKVGGKYAGRPDTRYLVSVEGKTGWECPCDAEKCVV